LFFDDIIKTNWLKIIFIMLNIYYCAVKGRKLKKVPEFKKGCWVHLENPTKKEIKNVSKFLQVDESLCLDAIDPNEVPRMERDEEITYFFTRIPKIENKEIITAPFLIAVGSDFILTISDKKADFLDMFIEGITPIYTTQRIKFFLQLLFAVNTQYNVFLTDISRKIRAIKFKIKRLGNQDIIQFIDYERILNDFLAALVPTATVISTLVEGRHIRLYEQDKELLEDVLLGSNQHIEVSKSTLKYIVNIREAYSTIMTNELNRVIKFLTSLTILLTVPTMISSFLGMNVTIPLAQNPSTFGLIILCSLLISGLLFIFFKRKDWI